jgi:hypothetical protein
MFNNIGSRRFQGRHPMALSVDRAVSTGNDVQVLEAPTQGGLRRTTKSSRSPKVGATPKTAAADDARVLEVPTLKSPTADVRVLEVPTLKSPTVDVRVLEVSTPKAVANDVRQVVTTIVADADRARRRPSESETKNQFGQNNFIGVSLIRQMAQLLPMFAL